MGPYDLETRAQKSRAFRQKNPKDFEWAVP